MHDHQSPTRRIPAGILAGVSVLILATGSAIAWWGWHTVSQKNSVSTTTQQPGSAQENPKSPTTSEPTETKESHSRSAPATTEKTLQVYWLKGTGSDIALKSVPVKVSANENSGSLVKGALEQLLAGPADSTVTTTIPRGTKLKSFAMKEDGVHIDLSKEFTSGGGSTSMTARLAQVLYTATSLNPGSQVWLSIEGEPLHTLGGEGLMIDQPLTRKGFEKDFSL